MERDKPLAAPRAWAPHVGYLIALLCIVGVAWCAANGTWSGAAWSRPGAYLEPEKADVVHALAMLKAASQGEFPPLGWKHVKHLGAPYNANWNDWPMVEEFQVLFFGALARIFGLFAGLNVAMLLGNLLAAVVMYLVARSVDCRPIWAFVAALAYGLAPFIFAQSPYHITCEWVWHVPLFAIVWRWVSTEPGLALRSPRWWRACGVSLLTGLLNPYFTNILCQLTLLGGAVQYIRNRSRPGLLAALAVIGTAAIAFALMNLDTWTYKLVNGQNEGALVREYKWLEIYGLKIKDLFIPPVTHRGETFANFSKAHRQVAPLLDEGASYQGIIGLVSLLWLVATSIKAMIDRRERDVPMETWWVLWIVLMFTTGGLNAIIGALGFTMFRGGSRYSIVILSITLLWAARRLSALQTAAETARPGPATTVPWMAAAAAACLVILWDQVPRAPTAEETSTIARQIDADREFTEKMEAALPDAAMVFQLPVVEFPESPAPGVPPYDHFRPYLYSKNLRYSYGSMKGRERERWQLALQGLMFEGATLDQQGQRVVFNAANFSRAVSELKKLGFSAIYINRNGFPDRAKGLEDAILELGYSKPPIRNATGDLACIVLDKGGDAAGTKNE